MADKDKWDRLAVGGTLDKPTLDIVDTDSYQTVGKTPLASKRKLSMEQIQQINDALKQPAKEDSRGPTKIQALKKGGLVRGAGKVTKGVRKARIL